MYALYFSTDRKGVKLSINPTPRIDLAGAGDVKNLLEAGVFREYDTQIMSDRSGLYLSEYNIQQIDLHEQGSAFSETQRLRRLPLRPHLASGNDGVCFQDLGGSTHSTFFYTIPHVHDRWVGDFP